MASASRRPLQAEDLFASRFDGQGVFRGPISMQASEGEARRTSLSLDWLRWLSNGSLRAGAFASARELAANAGPFAAGEATLWERVGQQDRGTKIGAHLTWSGFSRLGALGFGSAARLRFQGESLDLQGRLDRANGEAPRFYLDDGLRQSFAALDLSTETHPVPGLRASAAIGIERYRFAVTSAHGTQAGADAGTLISPRLELAAAGPAGSEYFASIGRGTQALRERGPTVAFDPRDGAPLARLDPAGTASVAEAGWRTSWARGIETRLSAWQAKSEGELLLVAGGGVLAIDRPTVRSGITISARHQPAPWLSLDIDATALDARYRDGAREKARGTTDRQVNAGATVRNGSKWSASLFVKYLGARTAVEEDALRLRSSTTVGAQFTSRLSKATRLTVDVFNVFNQRTGDVDYFSASRLWAPPGRVDGFLFHPAEQRGLRVLVSTRF